MKLDLINLIGDINPQWFRELKGRLNTRNVMVASGISLLTQSLLVLGFLNELPDRHHEYDRYCTGGNPEYYYPQWRCLLNNFGNVEINWQLWWSDLFVWLTVMGMFALLVGGTYILISDLDQEERRGTLNFIRLSPQSSGQIFRGKVLGAPILIYLGCILAFPLHGWAAMNAGVPLALLGFYYGAIFALSAFWFSSSLLLGLVSHWMGGFQAWLASGSVMFMLFVTTMMRVEDAPVDALKLVSPSSLIPYLILDKWRPYIRLFNYDIVDLYDHSQGWHWFVFPIGVTPLNLGLMIIVTAGMGTVWMWWLLDRCFRNREATLIGKNQSYWLTGCFSVLILGLAPHGYEFENLQWILSFNLVFFAGLMAALSPQRQVCVDWARYRHMYQERRQGLVKDLMAGERSPAVVAIALNLLEAQLIILPWIVLWDGSKDNQLQGIFNLILSFSILLLYATLAQVLMMMKSQKRGLWTMAAIGGAITLPPVVLMVLSAYPEKTPLLWMFTIFPWEAVKHASALGIMVSVLTQWAIVGLVSNHYSRQLRQAGISASQALTAHS